MSPRLLPYSSAPVTDTARLSPAVSGSDPASTVRWASGPGVTSASIVAVTDPAVAVMWCLPATVALQVWPQHEPSGSMASLADGPTSPTSLPYRSVPCMTTVSDVPARNESAATSDRCSSAAAITTIEIGLAVGPLVVVTVCSPAVVAVHVAAEHEPSGAIDNGVDVVTSPASLS